MIVILATNQFMRRWIKEIEFMKMPNMYYRILLMLFCCMLIVGCSSNVADIVNPYHGGEEVEYGERTNRAILEGGADDGKTDEDRARHALEVMKSYERAQTPQPYKPVLRPAVVRLMWIPDHLNRNGDLIPAHYYFLKVRDDSWDVQDAFELEGQLDSKSGNGGGATPWVYGGNK
jgi:hypothetical protein